MPKGRSGYSFPIEALPESDRARIAIALGKDLPIKWKHAREIANAIMERKFYLKDAIRYLKAVIRQEEAVPFKRFNSNVGHRKGMDKWKWPAGRYPKKASKYILKVLENALNNARQKQLDESRLKILLIAAHKGRIIRRRPDRRGPGILHGWKIARSTNVEVIVMELPEEEEIEMPEIEEETAEEEEKREEEITEEEEEAEGEEELEEISAEEETSEKNLEELESIEESEENQTEVDE